MIFLSDAFSLSDSWKLLPAIFPNVGFFHGPETFLNHVAISRMILF